MKKLLLVALAMGISACDPGTEPPPEEAAFERSQCAVQPDPERVASMPPLEAQSLLTPEETGRWNSDAPKHAPRQLEPVYVKENEDLARRQAEYLRGWAQLREASPERMEAARAELKGRLLDPSENGEVSQ